MAGLLDWQTEEDRIAQQRALQAYSNQVGQQQARQEVWDALGQTLPAQIVKSIYQAARLPGDVYQGKVDPRSDEAIGRAADLAGAAITGSMPFAVRGALGSGGGKMVQPDPGKTYWSDLAKTKLPIAVEDMSATRVPTEQLLPRGIVNPESLQGGLLMPAVGDRTIAGAKLTKVNDTQLAYPVSLEGGPDFMRAGANQADQSVWASDKGVISRLAGYTRKLAEESGGKDINFVYSSMGARSGDFSHMMSDALLAQLQGSKIPKAALKEFDDSMRAQNKNWPGLTSTSDKSVEKVREVLMSNAPMRKQFVEEMALGQYQKAGFPEIGSTRFAITTPDLVGQPTGASGYAISRLDPTGRVITSPTVPHTTYNTQLGGTGYLGGTEVSVPREIMFPDFYKERRAQNLPRLADDRAFTMSNVSQKADQEWLDRIMAFLEAAKSGQ